MLSERRNHIPFVLSEVRVSHVFYFLAGANFMIIASHCFYVQRCRTSYLNPRTVTDSDIEFALSRINYRPRKCLDFKQPAIVFKEMALAA
ncbi:TPA: hypothetical protein I7142_24895 [Vibrio vulnificus]|nr:hypothetical protein [Vibrio vulnificus]HAS6037023.1 hypothetical protein [Vibrio vulnificus]